MPLIKAIQKAGNKPPDSASREAKKGYSETLSSNVAEVLAEQLRKTGIRECLPNPVAGGKERRFAGGLGSKKVDVSFATEELGLALAISAKTISFRDQKTKNYQKNLANRRGDLLVECATLHRRFPFAVVGGLVLLDKGATKDGTEKRNSTFSNSHLQLKAFTGREDPADADEKFEVLSVGVYTALPDKPSYKLYMAGEPYRPVSLSSFLDRLVELLAERNPDHFELVGGRLERR